MIGGTQGDRGLQRPSLTNSFKRFSWVTAPAQAQSRARRELSALFTPMGPWTTAVLWHGIAEFPVPSSSLAEEIQTITEHRLAPLALAYIKAHECAVEARLLLELQRSEFSWTSHTSAIMAQMPSATSILSANDIRYVITKGPGVALAYPNARWRPYSDIDLLIRPASYSKAINILSDAGWNQDDANTDNWRTLRLNCYEALNLERQRTERVDVHRQLPPWVWGRRLSPVVLGEQFQDRPTDHYASFEHNLAICALHVVSDRSKPGQTLIIWRDLVQLATVVDVDRACKLLDSVGLSGWTRLLLLSLPTRVQPDKLLSCLAAGPVTAPRRLVALIELARTDRYPALALLARIPLWPNGLLYLAGMLFPRAGFLRAKFPDRRWRIFRWWMQGASGRKILTEANAERTKTNVGAKDEPATASSR